jgi:hypothetical protein
LADARRAAYRAARARQAVVEAMWKCVASTPLEGTEDILAEAARDPEAAIAKMKKRLQELETQ